MTNDPSVGNSAKISLIAFKISAQNTNLYWNGPTISKSHSYTSRGWPPSVFLLNGNFVSIDQNFTQHHKERASERLWVPIDFAHSISSQIFYFLMCNITCERESEIVGKL
jgi:hypothetical protein